MNLCKNCRWLIPPADDYAECGHPHATYRDQSPVTGKSIEHRWSCGVFRMPAIARIEIRCGPDGKLFEPRDDEPQAAPAAGFEP